MDVPGMFGRISNGRVVRRVRLRLRRRRRPWLQWLVPVALLLLGGSYLLDWAATPLLRAVAEHEAQLVATAALNRAMLQRLDSGLNYADLIDVRLDKEGRVAMLQPNTLLINRLAAAAGAAIQDEFDKITAQRFDVPLWQVLGSKLFADRGPRIPVRFLPLTTVLVTVHQDFAAAGINQTRHVIELQATVTVQIVTPLLTQSQTLHASVPLSEAVIVGPVPGTYLQGDLGHYQAGPVIPLK